MGLDDPYHIAHLRLTFFIVSRGLRLAFHYPVVQGVRDQAGDLHDNGLGHLIADNNALKFSAAAPFLNSLDGRCYMSFYDGSSLSGY